MVSTYMALQVGQRTHDERQRRANIVSGVNQEFHLFLIQVLIGSASVVQQHKNHYSNNYCQINAVSQCGAIPRCLYSNSHCLHRCIIVTLLCPHLNAIGTWLEMTQRKVINASRISNPIAIVHPILQEYVRWVVEVHLWKAQRDGMIQITQREMIRLADRFFCYLYVVQFGTCIHCLSTHKKSCQMQRVGGGMVLTDSPW